MKTEFRTMRSRYKVLERQAPHFITSTVVEWLLIFKISPYCDMLINPLQFCHTLEVEIKDLFEFAHLQAGGSRPKK